ncbi:MAG: hypothetical protein ABIP02_06750 [Arenimonas sp.]
MSLFVGLILPEARATESVAMVTDLEGKAELTQGNKKSGLSILSDIKLDAQMKLEAGARTAAVYLKSGQEYEFKGPALIQFNADKPVVLDGAKPQQRGVALAKGGKEIRIKPVVVAQAAIVMRSVGASMKLKLLSLSGTKTLEARPVFRWQEPQRGLKYEFELLDEAGKKIYQASLKDSSITLPANVQLNESTEYTWVVSTVLADGGKYSNAGDFSLASNELRAEMKSLAPDVDATLSDRVVYATWLEQVELRDEARKYWRAIAAERNGDLRLKVMAGD